MAKRPSPPVEPTTDAEQTARDARRWPELTWEQRRPVRSGRGCYSVEERAAWDGYVVAAVARGADAQQAGLLATALLDERQSVLGDRPDELGDHSPSPRKNEPPLEFAARIGRLAEDLVSLGKAFPDALPISTMIWCVDEIPHPNAASPSQRAFMRGGPNGEHHVDAHETASGELLRDMSFGSLSLVENPGRASRRSR
jgi:hypothetical protein